MTVVEAVADADGDAELFLADATGARSCVATVPSPLLHNDAGSMLLCCARACSSGVTLRLVSSTVCCISMRSLLLELPSLEVIALSLKEVFVL